MKITNILLFMNALLIGIATVVFVNIFRYEYQTETINLRALSFDKIYKIDRLTGDACVAVDRGEYNFNCNKKVGCNEFGATIKKKYPEYSKIDNCSLARKFVKKYPIYKSNVDFKQE